MREAKNTCRKNLRKILSSMTFEDKKSKSTVLGIELQQFLLQKNLIHSVGGFYPLDDEVFYLGEKEFVSSFPFMTSDEHMIFKECRVEDLIETSSHGRVFREPPKENKNVAPEVLVIPGLGFDKRGNRLGRGKGYYDRYLSKNNVVKIGICFHEQLVDEIPIEEYDVLMDFIITDKTVLELNN